MSEHIAVQVREGSFTWHATVKGGTITHCGMRAPINGWAEWMPIQYILNENWCRHRACIDVFNQVIYDAL